MNPCFKIELVRGTPFFVLCVFLMRRDAHTCFVVAGVPWAFTFLIWLRVHAPMPWSVLHRGAAFAGQFDIGVTGSCNNLTSVIPPFTIVRSCPPWKLEQGPLVWRTVEKTF